MRNSIATLPRMWPKSIRPRARARGLSVSHISRNLPNKTRHRLAAWILRKRDRGMEGRPARQATAG